MKGGFGFLPTIHKKMDGVIVDGITHDQVQ